MEEPKKKRGFALFSPEQRKQYAALGGSAVPREKRAFSANRELAVEAGRKGGSATKKKAVPNVVRKMLGVGKEDGYNEDEIRKILTSDT